jgi:hypothetical protein
MKLITQALKAKLIANYGKSDQQPVVKFFTPDANFTWLFVDMDPEDNDQLFGLCDLGQGFPELGYASLRQIEAIRGKLRLPVERDLHFTPRMTITEYADKAHAAGRIIL